MPTGEDQAVWTTYQAAWRAISASERQTLLERSVAADCVYTDPTGQYHGQQALIAKIEQTQRTFPGASFEGDTFVEHHAQALASWTMHDVSGRVITTGTSYARFGEDGRLTLMTGFFAPPARELRRRRCGCDQPG